MKKISTSLLSAAFIPNTLESKALRIVVRIILFLIIFSSFGRYTVAGTREKQDISKMVQSADLIIRGRVASTKSQWKEDARGRHIYTSVTVNILDKMKGDIKDNAFAFEVVGGTVNGIGELVSDTPSFETDEDAIVFLAGHPLTVRQGIESKIPIHNGRVYRDSSGVTVDSFIRDLKIIEQDPNARVFQGEAYQNIMEGTADLAECYKYNNLRWPGSWPAVSYYINENTYDCTGEGAAVQAAANTWNNIGANFTFQYAGTHTSTYSSMNNVNEIMWGTTSSSVATTYYWYYLPGDIFECDIVFNDTAYNWCSTTPNSSQMDVQSVALHEFGHWLNLVDLYNSGDSGNVMYGYIMNGQVKRDLQPCDIQGICYIYGGCTASRTLSVNSSGASGISITSSTGHGGTTNYTRTLTSGTAVTLTAPSMVDVRIFTGWTGDVTSSSQTISFSMNGSKTVTANYVTPSYTLSVNSSGASGVAISSSTGHGGTTNYTKTLTSGTAVTLTAPSSAGGKVFTGWTGSVTNSSQIISFTINGNTAVTANYETLNYTLSINSSGASGISIDSSTGHGGTTNYTKTVTCLTTVTLTAPSMAGGKIFSGWTGNVASSNQTISFTMDGNKTVTADFAFITPPVLRLEPNAIPELCNIISWDSVPPAKAYYAECAGDPCFLSVDYSSGWITKTSYQFCGLTGCREWYRVKSGLSVWSQTSQAEFQSDTLTNITATGSGDVSLADSATFTAEEVGNANGPMGEDAVSYLNGFLVTTSTTLAKIEVYLNISTSTSIEFVVYQGGPSFSDQYNKIHSSTLASSGTGAKFYTSGLISVPLHAGLHYMFGAICNGSSVTYLDASSSSTSFANSAGWGYCSEVPAPDILSDIAENTYTFYHRYTTGQPGNGYLSNGNIVSTPINLPAGGSWGIVDFNTTKITGTQVTVDVLPVTGSTPITGYENVPSGADLSGISASAIRLRANLSTNDPNSTPVFHDWLVTYDDPAGIQSVWSNIEYHTRITPGDFESDCDVDWKDLAALAEQWLLSKLSADVWPNGGNGIINSQDFAVFAKAWQSVPSSPNWNPKCDIAPQGGDDIVDIEDLSAFTEQWLLLSAYSADIAPLPDGDGIVNWFDFALLAENWMKGI